ncbi:putative ribonuclease H-like domain-containing protein [Tanacetum coccineum]|uniref:Ribonuclease H-like domain-containing protein n=1 Tax=Tanacetum coccineum TaxID=301880 RepID=A0ABQ5BP10_9ASTR
MEAGVSTEDANQKFLRSLPSAWSQVSLIMRTKPGVDNLSFDDLYNNLRVFESDIKGSTASSSSSQNVAFVSENTSTLLISLYRFITTGRKLQFDAKEPVGFDKTKVECYNCHKTGHFARECRIKGTQDNRRRDAWNSGNKDGSRTVQKEDSKALVTIDGEGVDWTNHSEDEDYALMACNSSDSDTEREQLSDASIEIKAYSQGLKKVEVALLLLEVVKVIFTGKGGLACLIAKATTDESNKWHRRLGHVNFKNLNKLVKGNLVRGLPSKIFQNDHTCVACQKGKQHKASCKAKAVSSISQTLQLLHMDLFGPTSVRSLNHKTYCLVITDDFSRFSWVFFLRTKDETSAILKDFIRQIENQLNQKVKTIRSDNGTEFKNKEVIEFCGIKGIKREYSNARTPQQNGVAERKNRTLIEAARTMLADSFLPNTFWAEAVSTACYVLNRVLVTKPHNKTPYELLTGKIPIISYIRPFGCHVTILNTIDHLGKFAGKSDEGFLVGYSLQSKAFRVYNLETKRVEENLHITFLENKPNVAGKGPTWLFDLDYLTDSMNYHPVSSENQANLHAGQQEANQNAGTEETIDVGDSDKEDDSTQDCFVLPIWPSYSSTNTPAVTTDDKRAGPREEEQVFMDDLERLKKQEKEANEEAEVLRKKFETLVIKEGAAKPSISTASPYEGLSLSDPINPEEDDSEIPPLEDIYQNSTDEELLQFEDTKGLGLSRFALWEEGYREGIDYDEVFAPVAGFEAIRIFLAFASYMGFIVYQMDVKSAFLYGKIDEEVYVSQPPGFLDPKHPQKVYKVVKALYGLHQAPRACLTLLNVKMLVHNETQKPLVKDEEANDVDVHLYRSMIGSLMYLTASRPDIMFAVCACSRFQVTPKTSHLSVVKRIFSDYAGANLDRKSTTGGCQFLGRRLISWQCKKQTIVATSTTEAEYVAAASCCGQVLWIQNQIPVYHSKTKHIAIRHHFIRDAYEKKLIQVLKIHTDDNVADLLTKAFDVSRFQFLVVTIGMINP